MTSEPVNPSPEARERMDAYLDAIERVLVAADMPRAERKGIADDVEAQILEMLAARAGAEATAADVEAVLSDLDPPEAYAEAGGAPPASTPGAASPVPPPAPPGEAAETSMDRTLGIVSLALCLVGALFTVPMVGRGFVRQASFLAFLGCEIAALVCGIIAWRATPLAKAGTVTSSVLMSLSFLLLT